MPPERLIASSEPRDVQKDDDTVERGVARRVYFVTWLDARRRIPFFCIRRPHRKGNANRIETGVAVFISSRFSLFGDTEIS